LWALFQVQRSEMKGDIWLSDSFSLLIRFKIQQWSGLCPGGKSAPLPSILLRFLNWLRIFYFSFFCTCKLTPLSRGISLCSEPCCFPPGWAAGVGMEHQSSWQLCLLGGSAVKKDIYRY